MRKSQPNILLIMSDQHNPAMAGYAGNTTIKTPHLDRLAQRATVFSSAYCTSPICVPARASIATGRYVHEIDAWDNAAPFVGAQPSWGHHLSRAGYRVTTIGKLHYRNVDDDTGFPDQRLAMHIHGRGDLLGIAQRPDGAVPTVAGFRTILDAGPGENDYTRYDRAVTDSAVRFIAQEIDDQPWALMVSFVAPHFPLVAPHEFFDLYNEHDLVPPSDLLGAWDHPAVQVFRKSFGIARQFSHTEKQRAVRAYLGLCSFMDANVGAVLAALDRSGQTDKTVVTYTSDHGESAGAHGLWFKHLMNEESVGVPLMLAGPEFAHAVIDQPVSHIDLMPTFLSLAGLSEAEIEVQCGAPPPGTSLVEYDALSHADRVVMAEYHANGSIAGSFMVRHGRYKYIEYIGERPQLFDLSADPGEIEDLAGRPEMAPVVADCASRLRQICDPQAVDALAKRDQARRVDEVGGVAAASAHTVAYTPVPGAAQKPARGAAQHPQHRRCDVVGLGESMLTLFRDTDGSGFSWDIAGAESNVVRNCAALGMRTRWISRLGAGVAGPMVHDVIAGSGVDTSGVVFSADAPTGLLVKGPPDTQPRVQYYRRQSAASEMSTTVVDIAECLDTAVLHLTGITLALSENCSDLVLALLDAPATALRSFDLNWRPALWSPPIPSDFLADVTNRADLAFVGLDEAEAVWGLSTPADVRELLDRPRCLVVKDGVDGAHAFVDGAHHFVPALRGTVVDPIGAGDAFAAGFIYGIVNNPDDVQRWLRLGHIIAMSAVSSPNDVGQPPDWSTIDSLLDLDSQGWAALGYGDPAAADR